MLVSLAGAIQVVDLCRTLHQGKACSNVFSSANDAPSMVDAAFECIGKFHEVEGGVAYRLAFLGQLSAALLDAVARFLM